MRGRKNRLIASLQNQLASYEASGHTKDLEIAMLKAVISTDERLSELVEVMSNIQKKEAQLERFRADAIHFGEQAKLSRLRAGKAMVLFGEDLPHKAQAEYCDTKANDATNWAMNAAEELTSLRQRLTSLQNPMEVA